MKDVLKKILIEAVNAPSGENVQPWKFEIQENKITVINIPERDQSPYNFMQRGSLVSHGALIENIIIIAGQMGFKSNVILFPQNADANVVAIIDFVQTEKQENPLYAYIAKRATNRKPYKKQKIETPVLQEILQSCATFLNIQVAFNEKGDDIKKLALAGAMNERLVLENKTLHEFLFTHINWTEQENQIKKMGFYIKTLELPPPAQFMFKLVRNWKTLSILNHIGISKAVWKQNAAVYASAPVMGVISSDGNTKEDFVTIGRVFQRIWLTATKMDLSLQPMTGVLFFQQKISAGDNKPFWPYQIELVKNSYEEITNIFGTKNRNVPIMFRIGYSDPPSARALKLSPEIIEK